MSGFPSNKFEALAMLYLQNQDLSDLTPEELLCKYEEVCEKIEAESPKQKARGVKQL